MPIDSIINRLEAAERLLSAQRDSLEFVQEALISMIVELNQMSPPVRASKTETTQIRLVKTGQKNIYQGRELNRKPESPTHAKLHAAVSSAPNNPLPALKLVKADRTYETGPRYTSPRMVFDICKDMAALDREHFAVLHLDVKNRIIAKETVSIGSLTQAIVHPREVFKAAVHNGSAALILAHNHPAGDPTPSNDDILITQKLKAAGEIIGIRVLDHIIIGDRLYHSFADEELREVLSKKAPRRRKGQ